VFVKMLVEAGTIRAIVDRCYPMEQTAAAGQDVDSGCKTGHAAVEV
jgi:hypothetical protein